MGRSGPRMDARSLSGEDIPSENRSGPVGSPCLTPCAEVMMCLTSGQTSTRLEVQPSAHLPPDRGWERTGGVPRQCPPVDGVEFIVKVGRGEVGVRSACNTWA